MAVTDETGNVAERLAYDAFGKRRYVTGAADPNNVISGVTVRHGYTSHEMLDGMRLTNMNGRMYDPELGRFISADPNIQSPYNLQSYNRYSYAWNNPLIGTDPSGYFLDGLISIPFIDNAWNNHIKPALPTIVAVAAAYYTGVYDGGIFGAGNAIANGAAGGFAGGFVGSGGNFNAGLQGAFSGALFGWAGGMGDPTSFERYTAHAFAGCVSGEIGSGGCGRGAFSAVAGKWATNATNGDFVATVVAGGTVSAIGGGKFANGAETAAFGYLFNYCSHDGNCTTKLEKALWDWMPGYKAGTCINDGNCTAGDWARATVDGAMGIVGGVEVKGAGAAADFFAGSTYTNKVLGQMGNDLYHGFPLTVDAMAAEAGQVTRIVGGDGAQYLRLQVDGAVNGVKGTFEYIKDSLGNINHRLFRPN